MKPKESGGNVPKAKKKVRRVTPPTPEVSVQAIKPQKTVRSKKGSFPTPRPEVQTPAPKRTAKPKVHFISWEDAAKLEKAGKLHVTYQGGDPLSGLNRVFSLASAEAGKGLKKVGAPKIVRNAAKEVIDSPAQAVPATAMAITHPKMVVRQIKQTVTHPVKSFEEQPVTTLLLARGALAGAGRAAGATLRVAPKGTAIHKLGSTERVPLKLESGGHLPQRYSKDVTVKAVQKAGEKSKRVVKARAKRAEHRQLDRVIGTNEGVRRVNRDRAIVTTQKAAPKHGKDAVALVNEGVIKSSKTVKADLEAELARLHKERGRLKQPAEQQANAANIASVTKLLADEKFLARPHDTITSARSFARTQKQKATPALIHYGDLTKEQALTRPLLPHAVREMGLRYDEGGQQIFDRQASLKAVARHNRKTGAKVKAKIPTQETTQARFVTPSGKTVAPSEIIKDFKAKGGDPRNLAYVPERLSFKGSRNFYEPTSSRPSPDKKVFKGKNTKAGLYERDYDVLVQQASKAAGRVSRHEGIDRLINQYGKSKPGGGYFKWDEAQKEILNQRAVGKDYVPLQILRGQSAEAAGRIKEGLNPDEMPQMFRPAEQGDGKIVLLPAAVAKRIAEHENIGTRVPLVRGFQAVNQRFRHAVLPTSPRWAVGNLAEMLGRMAIEDPTLFKSVMTGRHVENVLRQHGGQKAVDILRSAAGTGHIGAQAKWDIYRAPEHAIVKAVHAVRKTHGPKEVVDAWDLYKRAVFGANTRAEDLIYYAGLGKEASRQVHEVTGAWHKTLNLGGKAYEDVAKGLLDSPNVERYARAIDDMRGRYSNLSPKGRSLTLTLTPFAPWYVNALHFVFVTLPVHHPIKTALLGQTVESQRKKLEKLGITHFEIDGVKPTPAYLLGRVGNTPAAQFTPFGAFTDVGGNAANLVLPQASGVIKNLGGQDFAGRQLKDAKGKPIEEGDPRTIGIALNTLAESFVPFLRHARTIREKGGSHAATSTVLSPKNTKYGPGKSTGEGLKRAFNPFYGAKRQPVKLKKGSTDPLFHDAGKSTADPLFR